MTCAILAMSALIQAASSSGELPTTSDPVLRNFSLASGVLTTRTISWFSRLMIASGVLAGARTPVNETNYGFALVYDVMKRGRTDDARRLGAAFRELVREVTSQFDAICRFMGANGRKDYDVECFEALLAVVPVTEDAR